MLDTFTRHAALVPAQYVESLFERIGRHDLVAWVSTWPSFDVESKEMALDELCPNSVFVHGQLYDNMYQALMRRYLRSGMMVRLASTWYEDCVVYGMSREPSVPNGIEVVIDEECYQSCGVLDEPWMASRALLLCRDSEKYRQAINDTCWFDLVHANDHEIEKVIPLHMAATRIIEAMRTFVRRVKAARIIQFHMRPWLDKPKCADGTVGIRLRILLKDAMRCNFVRCL
jgi:hypothetical protein